MKKQIRLLTLSLVLMSFEAKALSNLDNPIKQLFGRGSEPAGPCPLAKHKVPLISYQEMSKAASELKLNQNYCEANAYYRSMMANAKSGEQMEHARYEYIESSFYQRDYDEMFRQATLFLQQSPKSTRAERVYYLAIKAVDENIELTNGNESRWIQAGLGAGVSETKNTSLEDKQGQLVIKDDSTDENGLPIPTFSFKAFLDLYPNSPYAVHVKEILDKVRSLVSGKFILEARDHAFRWDYAPALSRLKVILNQGPSVDCFAEALFEAINYTYGFAYRVKNENQIPTYKLAKWLILEENEITPELRAKLSVDLEKQAHAMKKMMKEKLPHDKWTKRLM